MFDVKKAFEDARRPVLDAYKALPPGERDLKVLSQQLRAAGLAKGQEMLAEMRKQLAAVPVAAPVPVARVVAAPAAATLPMDFSGLSLPVAAPKPAMKPKW
jgi:hypothetical protein